MTKELRNLDLNFSQLSRDELRTLRTLRTYRVWSVCVCVRPSVRVKVCESLTRSLDRRDSSHEADRTARQDCHAFCHIVSQRSAAKLLQSCIALVNLFWTIDRGFQSVMEKQVAKKVRSTLKEGRAGPGRVNRFTRNCVTSSHT